MKPDLDHPCKQTCSGWQQGRERGKKEMDARLKRTVTAAYHALLEMSAFLGIPEKKRLMQVEYLMENVRFCADNDEGSAG